MRLKFLPGDLHRAARLVTESGEILAEFGVDPEFGAIKLYADLDGKQKAEIILDLPVGNPATVIEADEQAVRALPDAWNYIELSPEQVQDNLDRLRPRPFLKDYDVEDDDGDFFGFRDDEEEWDDEDEEDEDEG